MKSALPVVGFILLLSVSVVAQTQPTPPSNTTIVVPDNAAPASSTTSVTSTTGLTETTIINVKRDNGSLTTIITQQPQSTYQPMGPNAYQPMGQGGYRPEGR
jgi:hypothetical protein